ncbi:hypothetical protein OG601_16410 [Streptomyces sp. NBC_01239]|uniref:hypothetical protein n=1 Tax=Streptomyces sp. NBC_01239 TaxID=2903792 RepID=UPI002259E66B|nr:hypothetical protein [Streptomyces sp. NBC_01239]MCX4812191.1 hypothetical protein [Streptomyces sp. NBC_01239]
MTDSGVGELERLRARVAVLEAERRPRHRARSLLAVVFVVLGCVLAPLAAVAAWTADTVGDTDRYVATVAPLASDRDIQHAVAGRVTSAVMDHLDLTALLSDAAPDQRPLLEKALGALGGSLEDAVRAFVHDKAQSVAASGTFATIWKEANRRIHRTVDKALTGSGGGAVKLDDGAVTLDVGPVVDQVKQRLVDDGMTAAGKIPELHTSITLLKSDDLDTYKTYFRLLQLAGTWLPLVAVVLVAAGVLLAGRRRRALVTGALGVAATTALLGLGLRIFRTVYLDALPAGVSSPAAGAVYDALTRFLHTTVRNVVALGLVIALAAWLTGPGRRAGLVRRLWTSGIGAVRSVADGAGLRTGPVGPFVRRYRMWIGWVLVGGALLAYLLWSYPTGWVVVGLALALLFALAVVEFLAAEPGEPAESADGPGAGPGSASGVTRMA